MKFIIRRFAMPLLRLYWKIFKPHTFGVKILLKHPSEETFLIVRHSYGDRTLWNIPGGGYSPKKETPILAAAREIQEEFGCDFVKPSKLGTYSTASEGKQDKVAIIFAISTKNNFPNINSEIEEYQWEVLNNIKDNSNTSKVAKYAAALLIKAHK